MSKSFVIIIHLLSAVFLLSNTPVYAVNINSYDKVIEIVKIASVSNNIVELDRLLRKIYEEETSEYSPSDSSANLIVWMDNWNPMAKITLKNVTSKKLFNNLTSYPSLQDAVDIEGEIDLDLEIRTGSHPSIEGQLRMSSVTFSWENNHVAVHGINGFIPFRRTFDNRFNQNPIDPLSPSSIWIDTLIWNNRIVATHFNAKALYENKVLRFDNFHINFLGGKGIGSIVIDHRGNKLKMVSAIKFEDVNLLRLPEILPGVPYFARVTMATVQGDMVLSYAEPNYISISGEISSIAPGVIEFSPLMRERTRDFLDSRVLQFQKLVIKLGKDKDMKPEASIILYQRTAQTLKDIIDGIPFNPIVLTVRIPIVPFVVEMSKGR